MYRATLSNLTSMGCKMRAKIKKNLAVKNNATGDLIYTTEDVVKFIHANRANLRSRAQCIDLVQKQFGLNYTSAVDTFDSYFIQYEQFSHESQEQLAMGILTSLRSTFDNLEMMKGEFMKDEDRYGALAVTRLQTDVLKSIAKIFLPQQVNISVTGIDDAKLKRQLLEYYGKNQKALSTDGDK